MKLLIGKTEGNKTNETNKNKQKPRKSKNLQKCLPQVWVKEGNNEQSCCTKTSVHHYSTSQSRWDTRTSLKIVQCQSLLEIRGCCRVHLLHVNQVSWLRVAKSLSACRTYPFHKWTANPYFLCPSTGNYLLKQTWGGRREWYWDRN